VAGQWPAQEKSSFLAGLSRRFGRQAGTTVSGVAANFGPLVACGTGCRDSDRRAYVPILLVVMSGLQQER
jgi:hypothetical protein